MKSCEDILSKTLYGLCVQVGVLFGGFLNCMVNVFLKMYGLGNNGGGVEGWRTCREISGLKYLIHKKKKPFTNHYVCKGSKAKEIHHKKS